MKLLSAAVTLCVVVVSASAQNTFNYTGSGPQTFTAPFTGTYRIVVDGAAGGAGRRSGGTGAEISGDFNLTVGQVLKIYVGGSGANGQFGGSPGGGGGGSFVTDASNNPLVIAGGGGGGGLGSGGSGLSGPGSGSGGGSGSPGCCGGGGGGGFTGNGANGGSGTGGLGFPTLTGGTGGLGGGAGGYGGGGGAGDDGAGGGGGYSGGNGGTPFGTWEGDGGGSFFAATGANEGTGLNPNSNGKVFIGNVTINSLPTGLSFTTSGAGCQPGTYTTSQTFFWTPGTTCTVTFSSPQAVGPGIQYAFTKWEDNSTNASRVITASTSATTYTGFFTTQYQLTTMVSPAGGGTATPIVPTYYDASSTPSISATANAGYVFANWTGPGATFGNANLASTTVSMTGPLTVTANFNVNVTITSSPSGRTFTTTGTGCAAGPYTTPQTLAWTPGSSCTVTFSSPQAGTLGTQYVFTKWEDNSTNAARSITAPTSAATYTATFKTQYQLTTAVSPAGGGTATPSIPTYYDASSTPSISATANAGYVFANWTGPGATFGNANLASTTVSMTGPLTVTANFNVNVTITSSPTGLSFTTTGTGCAAGPYTAPQTLAWTPGSSCIVTFSSPQAGSPGTQYVFSKWEDNSTNAARSITAPTSPTTYTATFKTQYQLTTAVSPAGGGTATPIVPTYYNASSTPSISATANAGYVFANWTGPGATFGNANLASTTVSMTGPLTVTANFNVGVTIASSPTGLSFTTTGTGCAAGPYTTPQTLAWTPGSSCTVTFSFPQAGSPGTQYVFSKWEDNSTNAARSITAPTSPTTYTATFKTQYQLTTAVSPAGGGTATPSIPTYYDASSTPSISATANAGYVFANWTGPGATFGNANLASTTVSMTGPLTVTANFNVGVTIASSPTGLSFTTTGTGCAAGPYTTPQTLAWTPGSSCTVTFSSPQAGSPGTQYVFSKWEDNSTNASRSITAPVSAATYTATFNTLYQLTTAANPATGGTVSPVSGSYYPSGTIVNLLATPNSMYRFNSWTGNVASASSASTTITMNAPQSVTANFLPEALIGYAANLKAGDSHVNLSNAGTLNGFDPAGDICANVYVFAEDQQLIECCTCPLTPDHLKTLSAQNDLISNTLTPGVPIAITMMLVASTGTCNAANVTSANLAPGLLAWGTTLHATPGGGFTATETPFLSVPLSDTELTKITSLCGFIQANGSNFGICGSCREGAAGAKRQ